MHTERERERERDREKERARAHARERDRHATGKILESLFISFGNNSVIVLSSFSIGSFPSNDSRALTFQNVRAPQGGSYLSTRHIRLWRTGVGCRV